MATTGLLTLIDDIATLLDDVAVLSKVATQKTAGVLGDDLALNAQQVAGVRAEREIPVVWAVAKGSFVNKLILVPVALAISVFAAFLITPLLMIGGLFLCFEGFEKVLHKLFHKTTDDDKSAHQDKLNAVADPAVDMVEFERNKIKGAIRTDFILSAEIIVIVLGTVKDVAFGTQVAVVSAMAVFVTIAVYGLVAGIVKLDDAGVYLMKQKAGASQQLGKMLLSFAPFLMKSLGLLGTIAMFLVGGGIVVHGVPYIHHLLHDIDAVVGSQYHFFTETLFAGLVGVIAGGLTFSVVKLISAIKGQKAEA